MFTLLLILTVMTVTLIMTVLTFVTSKRHRDRLVLDSTKSKAFANRMDDDILNWVNVPKPDAHDTTRRYVQILQLAHGGKYSPNTQVFMNPFATVAFNYQGTTKRIRMRLPEHPMSLVSNDDRVPDWPEDGSPGRPESFYIAGAYWLTIWHHAVSSDEVFIEDWQIGIRGSGIDQTTDFSLNNIVRAIPNGFWYSHYYEDSDDNTAKIIPVKQRPWFIMATSNGHDAKIEFLLNGTINWQLGFNTPDGYCININLSDTQGNPKPQTEGGTVWHPADSAKPPDFCNVVRDAVTHLVITAPKETFFAFIYSNEYP